MPQHEGIRATLKRFGWDDKPYREYRRSPGEPSHQPLSKEVYVQSVSGERYYVLIELVAFRFESASDIRISWSIDGCKKFNQYLSSGDGNQHKYLKIKRMQRFIDGKWKLCALAFKDTDIDASAEPTVRQIEHDSDTYGRILVEITRGTRTRLDQPHLGSEKGRRQSEERAAFSKEVVKDNCISQATRYIPLSETVKWGHKSHFEPAPGAAGKPIIIVLRYRTKDSLEYLGIIPKSPTGPIAGTAPNPALDPCPAVTGNKRSFDDENCDDGDEPPPKIKRVDVTATLPTLTQPSTANFEPRPAFILTANDQNEKPLHAHPSSVTKETPASAATIQTESSVDRERRKALIRMRLEELRLERELFEMGD